MILKIFSEGFGVFETQFLKKIFFLKKMVYNRNIHEYTIKCYNSDFHGEGLLDTDVREVPSFYRKTKASLHVRIQKFFGPYFPTFEPKKLRIRTIFTQCV